MINPDGTGECDNCGQEEQNGGVTLFLILSDLDPDREGHVQTLHFCRAQGCDKKVRRKTTLKRYLERRETETEKQSNGG